MPLRAALLLSYALLSDAETCEAGHGTSAEHQAALLQKSVQAVPNLLAQGLERLILPQTVASDAQASEDADDAKAPGGKEKKEKKDTKAAENAEDAKTPSGGKGEKSETADATDAKASEDASPAGDAKAASEADDSVKGSEVADAKPSDEAPDDAGNQSATEAKTSDDGDGRADAKASGDGDAPAREPAARAEARGAGREEPAVASADESSRAAPGKSAAAAPAIAVGQPIAPFGKEDTGQELQDHAARTQDTLVDAIENAEVAEIKRSVFRTLTRLRAASIKEFDTIARMQTEAIDDYNDAHHYRKENPLEHLHSDEPAVTEDKYYAFH